MGVKQSSENEPWIDEVSNYFGPILLIWIGEEGKRCKSYGGKFTLKIRIGNNLRIYFVLRMEKAKMILKI